MRDREILYWLGTILILLGIILRIIGETSESYLPILYVIVGLAVITVILIIKMLIKLNK